MLRLLCTHVTIGIQSFAQRGSFGLYTNMSATSPVYFNSAWTRSGIFFALFFFFFFLVQQITLIVPDHFHDFFLVFVPDMINGEQKGQLAVLCRCNYTVFAEAVATCVYSDRPVRVSFVGVSLPLYVHLFISLSVCLSVFLIAILCPAYFCAFPETVTLLLSPLVCILFVKKWFPYLTTACPCLNCQMLHAHWWWWLFPHVPGFGENVRQFTPCLPFFL